MNIKRCIVSLFAVMVLGFGLPLAYAETAPVEDVTVEKPQPQAGAPVDDANSAPAYDDQQNNSGSAPDLAPPQSMSSSSSQQQTQPSQYQPATSGTNNLSHDERLDRLEQQMINITNMNMPQQIDELRQEIQQLTGRLQVQQHDIKVLENQQRSFYQDLNRRIQQIINSGNMSLTQKQKDLMAPKATVASAGAGLQDSTVYRSAFNLLVKKQYDSALTGFQDYIGRYPHGDFVANAYYWMGELYLKKDDQDMAIKSFSRVVSQFPSSRKVPDAKLKLAIIHKVQGKTAQAREEFNTIKRQYPNNTAAQLASLQLQRMGADN
ncbi:MAG: tol-pal system protein YbgF [Coxiellaceae bacterium]|nr:tol-pal system protein YbgF [Coxiellaceae bacterium]